MAGKIDPAFQAAPILQDSYNPVAFQQNLQQQKFEAQKAYKEKQDKNTAEGLDKLMLNLKGWEDQAGFKELLDRQNNAMNGFMALSRKGMNLISPKTTEEVMAYKALTDYHAKTKELADQWGQQKTAYDLIQKELMDDDGEKLYDHKTTQKNLADLMNTHSIADRRGLLESAIVRKPQAVDYAKIIKENKDHITPPPITQVVTPPDPVTGEVKTVRTQGEPDDKLIEKNKKEFRDIWRGMTPEQQKGLQELRKRDEYDLPNEDGMKMSDPEYLYTLHNLAYKQQYIEKKTGSGGGGININIGGTQAKITPGIHNKNENNLGGKSFNDRYDFTANKPFQVNALGGEKQTALADKKTGKDGWKPIVDGSLTKALLQFYDAKSKRLVFKSAEADDLPWLPKNSLFSVPIENMPEAMDFPIKKDDGTMGKLRDIIGEQGAAGTKSGISWK
jgi:hypothetical protein